MIDILIPQIKPDETLKAGKFGQAGPMKIKPYSIPSNLRKAHLKIFIKFVKISICGCWEWQGRTHSGYASCPTPGGNTRWAHRVSYALFNGDIKAQMHIDHECRNRICVRPDHLKQCTPIENYLAIQRRRLRDIKQAQEEKGQLTLW